MENDDLPHIGGQRHESLLSREDVETLTGRKYPRLQREALLTMGIPFAVNVLGTPLVPRSTIEGAAARGRREAKMIQKKLDDGMQQLLAHNARAAHSRRK